METFRWSTQHTRFALGKQSNILSINFAFPSGSSGKQTAKSEYENKISKMFYGFIRFTAIDKPKASTVIWNRHRVNSGSGSSLR